MLARTERNSKRNAPLPGDFAAFDLESKLASEIRKHCDHQWPVWKIISARPDEKSTIQPGAQDMTIFMPGSRVLCLELKSKTGKRSPAQLAWAAQMRMLGHKVHCIRTVEEFLNLTRQA